MKLGRPRKNPKEGARSHRLHVLVTKSTLERLRLIRERHELDSLADAVDYAARLVGPLPKPTARPPPRTQPEP